MYLYDTARDQSTQPRTATDTATAVNTDATGNLTYILEHKRGPAVRLLERCPDKPQIALR